MKRIRNIICIAMSFLSLMLTIEMIGIWAGSYSKKWSFAGGGLKVGIGNFILIYRNGEYAYSDADSYVHYYFWQPTAACAAASALFLRRCKFRKPKTGPCSVCGELLRATPDRCPECRTVPKGATA